MASHVIPSGPVSELIARARAGEKCERCYGRGKADPYCYRCSDSTDDHHCPPPEPCDKCGATGRVVDPLAVELAAELEKATSSNGCLLLILEGLADRLTPEESASVAREAVQQLRAPVARVGA